MKNDIVKEEKVKLKEENELLAGFLGWNISKYEGRGYMVPNTYPWLSDTDETEFSGEQMAFHESWDWLMPVVEKIDLVDGYSCIHIDSSEIYMHRLNDKMLTYTSAECGSKILAVHKAAVEFIIWYNQKKS